MHPQHENHVSLPLNPRARRSRAARWSGLVAACVTTTLAVTGVAGTPSTSSAPAAAAPVAAKKKTSTAAAKKVSTKKVSAKRAAAKRSVAMKRLAKRYPRTAAKKMMKNRGYSKRQRVCVIKLWNKESNWRWWAANPSSSAYGIPQALPGRKMASAGADWRTNPVTQIKWGLRYIKDRYGSPCAAWGHSQARGWY